jgi:hypothetical protein
MSYGVLYQIRFAGHADGLCITSLVYFLFSVDKVRGKTIPVTDLGGPWGFELSRLTHFLDTRLTDGGEVVSFTCHIATGRIR